eukprot:XP_016656701.1 PREDICTED: uncharacterized protein LOC107882615 [Acyrthosiphon pisum]
MDSSYSIIHFFDDDTVEAIPSFWMKDKMCAWPKNKLFIKKFIEKKMAPANDKEFKFLKARVLSKGIKTLEHARKLADEGLYRSDFSADESFINKPSRNLNVENEDKHQSQFTNEGISISEKKNGWSPSPQKLRLLKSQPTTTIFTSSSKLSSKSTSQEAFKGSSNKRLQYNQDENEQASGSELKRKNSGIKNPVSRKKLFDNKSDDEHVMLNDVVNSSEYRNISYENDSNKQVVVDIRPRIINNSKRQNTHNISIGERDDLDEQLFSRPIGHNTFKGSSNKRLQYNQDENEQASGSELKRKNSGIKNPVSRKKLFDNKSDDEHVMLNDVVNSSEYKNISFENDSNEQGVVDISSRNINNSKRQNTHNISIAERDDLDEQLFSRPIGHNNLLQSQNQQLRNITFLKYELKQVLSNQTVILHKLDQMEKYLEQNSFNKPVMEVNSVDFSDCPLPIDNTYDLQTFEDKISGDQSYKNQLITELSHIGGKNVKSVVKKLMSKLFSDSLLAEYSYTGKKGKKKFSSLFICSVIFDSIKKQIKFKSTPLNEVEDIIKYILAQSPFSLKRQLLKNTIPNSI